MDDKHQIDEEAQMRRRRLAVLAVTLPILAGFVIAGIVYLTGNENTDVTKPEGEATADVSEQKKICEQIQLQAFQDIPFMPVGQWYYPWAIRKDLTDFVKCAQVLFWGVRRA